MRFVVVAGRLAVEESASYARVVPDDLGDDPLRNALASGMDLHAIAESAAARGERIDMPGELDPPLRRPGKLMAIGLNYRDHCRESGTPVPERPVEFTKHPSAITGSGHPIPLDADVSSQVDYEIELAVVIGRRCTDLTEADALSAVAGYTIANDVSARDVQAAEGQWVRAKSFDGFCPLGPALVTADEVPDPQALGLRTFVSGELLQDSNTSEMVFTVARLLAHVSQGTTLEPGDVLLTGTPFGVGHFRQPTRYLRPGDTVRCEIDGLGVLVNPVVARG